MTDIIEIEGGEVLANLEDRTITGRLIPFGEEGRTNVGRFMVEAGAVDLADAIADPSVIGLNLDHDRSANVGHGVRVWEQPDGVYCTWRVARTPRGDAALADALDPAGHRRRLSGEFGPAVIKAGKLVAGKARLWGSALVPKGAFDGAMVLAADTPDETPEHLELEEPTLPDDITVTTPAGESAVYTPEAEEAEEPTEEEGSTVTATIEAEVTTPAGQVLASAPATIPPTLTGTAPKSNKQPDDIDLRQVFAAMAQVKNGTQTDAADALQVLAALSDIKYNASGGLTTAGSNILQTTWVGKLWQGRRYVRKYIDLVAHFYGGIALGGRAGFTIDQGTALVQHWSGNKAAIPSGTASTARKASSLEKYGYGADVAREWYDLEGGAEVIQAFWEGVVESYAMITDADALDDIFATAAGSSLANLVAPDTFPEEYSDAMGMLIQGIDLVEDAGDVPSFAIVNSAARTQLRYTPKDLVPEFVTFTVAPEGEGTADGRVKVVTAPDSAFVGLDATEPAVLVGAKNGIEFREQGTTPIQIDAVNVANGGLDKAVVGYLETFVVRPESYVLIGTEAE